MAQSVSDYEIQKTLERLLPALEPELAPLSSREQDTFRERLTRIFPELLPMLLRVYGDRFDFFYHLQSILRTAAEYYAVRPAFLREVDAAREASPLWFQSQQMIGGVCYVDLFAGNLKGIREQIPYFKELGLTYLHLMPLFKSPESNNDGGYAISSFREVNPKYGTMTELKSLGEELRHNGINLVLDFVFNHTSDEHEWAKNALSGDRIYQNFYFMFPDRSLPDRYERNLREIFPEHAPGSFSYRPEIDRWVWTTFYPFQWDLNYRNPEVFNAMLGEMLFLANAGVDVLRLDAVAFIWKEMNTPCENLPQAHDLIQAFNALVRIAAPGMVFKSEAIVHPDEVARYFGEGAKAGYECPISYNPTLMALLWEALATREVKLLQHSMRKRFAHPRNCAWVNYVRVHDDIGWSFADEDAREMGMNPFDHRQFLNAFYAGEFEGSFARGLRFNFNPLTLDARICGMLASLAGLETALNARDSILIEHACRRIMLLYGVILSIGGIPLIYLGDELATLNDYSYQADSGKVLDQRWVHRPALDARRLENRHNKTTTEGRIFQELVHLIKLRKSHAIFAGGDTYILDTGNPHVFGYIRWRQGAGFLGLFNFSEHEQAVDIARFRVYGFMQIMRDLVSDRAVILTERYKMEPCEFLWLSN